MSVTFVRFLFGLLFAIAYLAYVAAATESALPIPNGTSIGFTMLGGVVILLLAT